MNCRACNNPTLFTGIDLGSQFLANDFLEPGETSLDQYPLEVLVCNRCGLGQLSVVVSPERLYRHYSYITPHSRQLLDHIENQGSGLIEPGMMVVEIASNTGVALGIYKSLGATVLGIEPADNLAYEATLSGLATVNRFFNEQTAKAMVGRVSPDVIIARHVVAHLHGLKEFFVNCVPWVVSMLNSNEFDTIYHEHLSYISVNSIGQAISGSGWYLNQVHQYPRIHGGSIGLVLGRNMMDYDHSVNDALRTEEYSGIHLDLPWSRLRLSAASARNRILSQIGSGSVGAYGAAAKGSVMLQWCGLDRSNIQFVVDTTAIKQGRMMPGTDIPIISPEQFRSMKQPEKMLILPWNHRAAIIDSEPGYLGEWITHQSPEVAGG
jgi:hypothetical protein